MSNEHKNKWSNAEIIKLAEEYYTKFEAERKKLPFWVNLVDVIGANENAHTRIYKYYFLINQKIIIQFLIHL